MSLPGLLIEYLITGIVSLLAGWWIFAEIDPATTLSFKDLEAAHVALLAPLAYLLGMFVDYLGKYLAEGGEWLIAHLTRAPTVARNDFSEETSPTLMHKAEIFARSAEVGKQYEMRKSRDRIARGLFANVVIIGLGGMIGWRSLPVSGFTWTAVSVLLIAFTFVIWRRCARLTLRYKMKASEALARIAAEAASQKATVTTAVSAMSHLPISASATSPTVSLETNRSQPQAG